MSWWEPFADAWKWYSENRADLTSIGALLGGMVIAWAALRQAGIAARRHYAQTEADRQRRITESFSKAVEQLGSDKIETRLGGIYTLERISRESPSDYWTIMETLTAFIRERARWKEPGPSAPETLALYENTAQTVTQSDHEPATDIAAVLSVILRRSDKNRDVEKTEGWNFDLRGGDLKGAFFVAAHLERADLTGAHLERAYLTGAHLERAYLTRAHLERAYLTGAHLEGANLRAAHLERAPLHNAHLEGADLTGAHLERAYLTRAHLERAYLGEAHLEEADLTRAHLEGAYLREAHLERARLGEVHFGEADLTGAHLEGAVFRATHLERTIGLEQDQFIGVRGDADTILPQRITRPADWPSAHTESQR